MGILMSDAGNRRRRRKKIDASAVFHTAADVHEALEIAEYLKAEGIVDLFRGQTRSYPPLPSVLRPGVDRSDASLRLSIFADWVDRTPALSSLHGNSDLILAVAQHYGLKTPFLDFSTDPQVAAFFASDGASGLVSDPRYEPACIIAVNREAFINSWSDINERAVNQAMDQITRIVEVDVRNLWRLQSQKGVFIDIRADATLLEMFSGFVRIFFPNSGPVSIIDRGKIYPSEKSHLENYLDQFLLFEDYDRRSTALDKVFVLINPPSEEDQSERFLGITSYFVDDAFPPVHGSWVGIDRDLWNEEPNEAYVATVTGEVVTIVIETDRDPLEVRATITSEITKLLEKPYVRATSFGWKIVRLDGTDVSIDDEMCDVDENDEYPQILCGTVTRYLWDGIRRLPYTDRQVTQCMSNYLTIAACGWEEAMPALWGETTGVEFESGPVRLRCCVAEATLLRCVREDFLDYVAEGRRKQLESRGKTGFLGVLLEPQRLFKYPEFVAMFVEEILPAQAVFRFEGDTFAFNPLALEVFGAT